MEGIAPQLFNTAFVLVILIFGVSLFALVVWRDRKMLVPVVLFGSVFLSIGLLMVGVLAYSARSESEHERELSSLAASDFSAVSFDSQRVTDPAHVEAIVTAVKAAKLCLRTYEQKRIRPRPFVLEKKSGARLEASAHAARHEVILLFTRDSFLGPSTGSAVCSSALPGALTAASVILP